ncbi:uncharacterized protein LOC144707782 [Wolffia australiana]
MRLSLWKPISQCAALIMEKKRRQPSDQPSDGPGGDESGDVFFPGDVIPDLDEAMQRFLATYPKYRATEGIERLRSAEYPHIDGHRVCLDYCGFGLFSYLQTLHLGGSCAFSLTEVSANLSNHVLHGGAEPGTAEHDIRARVMDYLNVPEGEYGLVFTASRGAAFKLLADCYPFQSGRGLLTVFDHESQAVDWMAQAARDRGARVRAAGFRWPTMRLCSAELRKRICAGRRRRRGGLFVFPGQSRVSGAKYSYQWMALAQQNKWHVLLDAGAMAPKDMDSLGLSLFSPDFIITSFYRIFGHDPSGFGCLLIKKTAIKALRPGPAAMVRVVADHPQYLSDGEAAFSGAFDGEDLSKSPVFSEAGSSENSLWPSPWAAPLAAVAAASPFAVSSRETDCEFQFPDPPADTAASPFADSSRETDCEFQLPGTPTDTDALPFAVSSREIDCEIQLPGPPAGTAASPVADSSRETGCEFPLPGLPAGTATSPFADSSRETHCEFRLPGPPAGTAASPFDAGDSRIEPATERRGGAAIISRETECEFRLLGRRQGKTAHTGDHDHGGDDHDDEDDGVEGEIICRHLDQVDEMGLNKTTMRLRYLVNWLVSSLLQLRVEEGKPLVQVYGPEVKYERGPAVAFNVVGVDGKRVNPEVVQKLAEREGISLGIGLMSHIKVAEEEKKAGTVGRVAVVTASLGFLSNFEDVYRVWAFVAKFLDPEFGGGDGGVTGGALPAVAEGVEL